MTELSDLVKLVDKAIGIERNASDYYSRASLLVQSPDGKKTLNWLAEFEKGHEARLIARRTALIEESGGSLDAFPEPGTVTSVSEADQSKEMSSNLSDTEIIMLAIENEDRIKTFYEKKSERLPDGELKDLFLVLMREEDRHIKILIDQRKHLEVNRIWGDLDEIAKKYQ